jgi:hypothetical protein
LICEDFSLSATVSITEGVGHRHPGIGNNEDAIAEVRGANCGRRNALPFRVIPEAGQVSENIPKSGRKEAWDILHECVSGS